MIDDSLAVKKRALELEDGDRNDLWDQRDATRALRLKVVPLDATSAQLYEHLTPADYR